MDLPEDECRRRFATARRAVLATTRPDGTPHLVPVVFALVDGVVWSAVDAKPKRSRQLQRLDNLGHEPRCSLLVDHYEPNWSRLWWVRADCLAEVVDEPGDGPAEGSGVAALTDRYDAYRAQPPTGPFLRMEVERWTGWSAG